MNGASLRARLLVLLLGVTLLVWGGATVLSLVEAHHEIDELYDAQLARSARILLAQIGDEPDEVEIEYGGDIHKYERKIVFQVWDAAGQLVLRSANAPATPLAARHAGFSDAQIEGREWRVFSHFGHAQRLLIQVGERHDVRDELTEGVVSRLLAPLLVAAPLLALLVWLSIGKGLAPLARVAAEVATREPQRLDPLDVGETPTEIRPLIDSLNSLLHRLDSALENERRFTADAAHELRTPLAALKIQAQVAQRAAAGEERHNALQQVSDGVDRATHLVEQLLTLARLDPAAGLPTPRPVALRSVAVACAALLAQRALDKHIELAVEDGDATLGADAAMLAILLRNLVDNAIRYTPTGGSVNIAASTAEDGAALLEVCDDGPGIAPEERSRVLGRFYRVLGSGEDGSGLGLSIAGRIAELHGATITLDSGAGGKGLCVRVIFPVAADR